jgi:hypothetical protein
MTVLPNSRTIILRLIKKNNKTGHENDRKESRGQLKGV